jgi:hypothetical protein
MRAGQRGNLEEPIDKPEPEPDRVHLLPRLLRGTPPEVLGRLASDDPLRLQQQCAKIVKEGFYLVDPDRVFERALARIAVEGPPTPASELNRAWLDARIRGAIETIFDEEREEEREAPFACTPEDPRYTMLRQLFIAGPFARTASWAFNRLPERTRRAFHYLALDKREVVECLALGIWSEDELYQDIWRALAALGYHNAEGRPEPDLKEAPKL